MATTDGSGRRAQRAARRIAGIYALVAAAWILLSDATLGLLIGARSEVTLAGSAKGLAFVAVTALMLHALVRRGEPISSELHPSGARSASHCAPRSRLYCFGACGHGSAAQFY